MGGDGGSIPGRQDLVIGPKKAEQFERMLHDYMKWHMCALSQQQLKPPIVACELGRLYNKEAVIQYLLDRGGGAKDVSDLNEIAGHIRSLRDVRELVLTPNPSYSSQDDPAACGNSGAVREASVVAQWACPIVGVEMNGRARFSVVWRPCGCVVSERAMKAVKSDKCRKCMGDYDERDVVILNATEEDAEAMRSAMTERRERTKLERKGKKRKEGEAKSSDEVKKVKKSAKNGEEDKKAKSVQEDPRASKIYKSLFTSSEKGQQQERGHWVTFDPRYN